MKSSRGQKEGKGKDKEKILKQKIKKQQRLKLMQQTNLWPIKQEKERSFNGNESIIKNNPCANYFENTNFLEKYSSQNRFKKKQKI